MFKKLKILFVEDVISDAELIWHEIEKNNISFSNVVVDNKEDYISYLNDFEPDLIISDYSLPNFDGMTALNIRNIHAPLIPFILVTGSVNEEVAVECMKSGADDYILKDNLSRLGSAIINSLNKNKLIKEKKAAEEELFRSEQRLKNAQALAHVGNWELDLSERSVWCSDEALAIYGFEKGITEIPYEIVKKNVLPEYRPLLDEAFNRLLKYNEPYEAVFKIKRSSDAKIRFIHSKAELVMEPDSEQVKVIGVIQDITERKRIEEELIRAKEKAEESDNLKTAFLHNISHEIRTPMNAIVGFSALLGEPDIDDKSRNSYIEVIMESSNHLLSIISDIVDISNIEANLVKTSRNGINVNSTLKTICNQFIPKSVEKNIDFTCEPGLSGPDTMIFTDSSKLSQIISNLISNAIKFTDHGRIKTGYKLNGKFLEFSVSDTGIGIPPEYHDKIFDRFYQVQSSITRLYEGTGLGLSISKAYVEQLGGKIWFNSDPGIGTTFFFTIPYERQVVYSEPVSENSDPDSFLFSTRKVILVAEDIESNFKLIRYFLAGSNAEVLHAYNGKEAVEKCLAHENIDLILMDIKMPEMDGYTAVKLIREKNNKIPIIAQTAYADDREKALECGCTGFISKPFDKKSLFKILSEFI